MLTMAHFEDSELYSVLVVLVLRGTPLNYFEIFPPNSKYFIPKPMRDAPIQSPNRESRNRCGTGTPEAATLTERDPVEDSASELVAEALAF